MQHLTGDHIGTLVRIAFDESGTRITPSAFAGALGLSFVLSDSANLPPKRPAEIVRELIKSRLDVHHVRSKKL
jgi:hypothetical protein